MKKKRLLKYLVSVGAIFLLLGSIVGLNILIQNDNETLSPTQTNRATRLDIAIVNEDEAVVFGNNTYNLGNSYIKKLEKDENQNWSVVTRARAESGDYQLVVYIPSDFSAKILDVESLSAEPATIAYEVRANGNQQIETEATKVGKDIVSDLNNQLVEMYMASILSNLYTAQQNVQIIAEQQTQNINSYSANLLGVAVDFQNNLPGLGTAASESLTANDTLIQSMRDYSSLFDTLNTSQEAFSTDLISLVEKRAQDAISYEEFANTLMALDTEELSADLATLTDLLQDVQSNIDKSNFLVNTTTGSDEDGDIVQNQITSLSDHIKTLEDGIGEQVKLVQEQSDSIEQFAESEVAKYYTNGSTLTVAEFLNLKNPDSGRDYMTMTADVFQNNLQTSISLALNQLPAIDSVGISDLANDMTYLDSNAAASLMAFDTTLAAKLSSEIYYVPSSLASELATAKTALETAKNNLGTSSQNNSNETQASDKFQDYQTAVAVYTAKVDEIIAAYSQAQTLLDQYYVTDDFLNQPVSNLLIDIVVRALTNHLKSYTDNSSASTIKIKEQIDGLKEKRDLIAEQLFGLQTINQEMTTSLKLELDKVGGLQTQIDQLKTQESTLMSSMDESESNLGILSASLTDLLSSTSELKATSESNVEEANLVNNLLSSFNDDVENAQNNSSKLAADAQDLMEQFNKELEASEDFVGSFVKVLNNAYSNGVANETILDFLSNPVTESANSVKGNVRAYPPFTWIVLLEIVSLFAAYLFATVNVAQNMKDKFRINKYQETDLLNTAVITLLAIIIGLLVGSVSANQLLVEREMVPSWVLMMTLFSLILAQGQYLFLKIFRTVGMGLSLFMLISFVYVSSAIGTTATLSGFPVIIKKMNLLSILETILSAYFDGQVASLLQFLFAFMVALILIISNLFLQSTWRKYKEKGILY